MRSIGSGLRLSFPMSVEIFVSRQIGTGSNTPRNFSGDLKILVYHSPKVVNVVEIELLEPHENIV
jgi:hypothetical protein